MCQRAKDYVDPKLNAVIVECWNEFGEGTYIEPTTQFGFGYLDALRTAFCQDNSHHLDVTPRQLGVTVPTYPEIPVFGDRQIAAQNGNLVYNPGFEKTYGWETYSRAPLVLDTNVRKSGIRSCAVKPVQLGIKSGWEVPVERGDRLEV